MREGVQAAVQARDRQRAGKVAHAAQYAHGTFVMVLEETGGNRCHGQHLAVTGTGKGMGAVTKRSHHVVNHREHGYNQRVVHGSLQRVVRVQATRIFPLCSMNDYPQSG